jgi:hypothetical protein
MKQRKYYLFLSLDINCKANQNSDTADAVTEAEGVTDVSPGRNDPKAA